MGENDTSGREQASKEAPDSQYVPVCGAEVFRNDAAGAVEDERDGDPRRLVSLGRSRVLCRVDGHAERFLLDEFLELGGLLVAHQGKEDTFRIQGVIEGLNARKLRDAGPAPCGPLVEKYRPATLVAEGDRFSIEVVEGPFLALTQGLDGPRFGQFR